MRKLLAADLRTSNDEMNLIALALICIREHQPIPSHLQIKLDLLWNRTCRVAKANRNRIS